MAVGAVVHENAWTTMTQSSGIIIIIMTEHRIVTTIPGTILLWRRRRLVRSDRNFHRIRPSWTGGNDAG